MSATVVSDQFVAWFDNKHPNRMIRTDLGGADFGYRSKDELVCNRYQLDQRWKETFGGKRAVFVASFANKFSPDQIRRT